ncbi:MAG: trans-sialidase, partial [Nitrosopumilus sp.]
EGVAAQAQQTPTPEPPKPAKGTLPKGTGQAQQAPPQQQSTYVANDGKSRQEKLADYEADYLQRIEQQRVSDEKAFDELLVAEAKARSTASRGTLPKGFEPKQKPEAPKSSRGTLPKGF